MKRFLFLFLFIVNPIFAATPDTIISSVCFQDAQSNCLSAGRLTLDLSQPARVTTGGGLVAPLRVSVTLDSTGKIPANTLIWGNDQLTPSGTTYHLRVFNSNGLLASDVGIVIIQGGSPVDLSQLVPISFNPTISTTGVIATGSPVSGNLTKWAGASSITNGDLSGDVTTSGALVATVVKINGGSVPASAPLLGSNSSSQPISVTTVPTSTFPALTGDVTTPGGSLATTLATVATAGTNTKITFNAKGLVTSGAAAQLASADFANQGTTTSVLHGNAAGNPSFSKVDLTNDTTNSLPVGSIAPGTNGQCINTSGAASVWGSCAGTAGVQVPSSGVNFTGVTVNAATAALQQMQSFSFAGGALNSINKTFRLISYGILTPVNTTESISLGIRLTTGAGTVDDTLNFTPSSTSLQSWRIFYICSTVTTGATGSVICTLESFDLIGGNGAIQQQALLSPGTHANRDLTGTVSVATEVSFSTASGSNTATSSYLVVEQLN